MRLSSMRVLLTGGAGGIGQAIAAELLDYGASVLLVGRDARSLQTAAQHFLHHGDRVATFAADLTDPAQRQRLCDHALHWKTGVNALINNAGICDFQRFERQTPQQIETALAINVEAPMHLCGLLLPHFQRIPMATIVNIGSVFGAIGYPGYAVYSATKFALRGFTEALRRELAHTSIRVRYLAPRATSTRMNSAPVERMNGQLRVAMDPPEKVAHALRRLIERERAQAVVGWPEAFFVRANALLPGVVDSAIRKQLPVILRHAEDNTDAAQPCGAQHGIRLSLEEKRTMNPRTLSLRARMGGVLLGTMLSLTARAQPPALDAELSAIQQSWAEANYQTGDSEARKQAFDRLSKRAADCSRAYPHRAEPLVWEGIVLSTYAGVKGGLGALGLAKQAREKLQSALKIDPGALEGSAYTSLGTLYHKVPGFPLGFGDDAKAREYLQRALSLNPAGIDPNYFYGEYLFDKGDYPQAVRHLEKALAAAPRANRELADQGRRREITALLERARAKSS